MSSGNELSTDDERNSEDDEECYFEESSEDVEALSEEDHLLFDKMGPSDAQAVAIQQALRDGANVNAVCNDTTPLMKACRYGFDDIVGILLDAGADARWRNDYGSSAILYACYFGNLSTVQLLINHDHGLLEMAEIIGRTPLFGAVRRQHSVIVRFLLDSGADPHHVDQSGVTALMHACEMGRRESARLLLAAGVDVEARDVEQQTALHYAVMNYMPAEVLVRELILQHNANMFAVDKYGRTPYGLSRSDVAAYTLREVYGIKLTQDHGRLALHELLKVAEYSFAEDEGFRPPLNPLKIMLPLGKLTLEQFRTLLHTLDPALIRNRDDTGKLPIHIACQTNSPVEVLALILELDPAALQIADSTGALPIHLLCGTAAATEYASVRYLIEQGGVGTLSARKQQGASPLHVLYGSTTNSSLRIVQYLVQSFPGSVAMRTNAGEYPFMMAAAADSSSASLSVVYELVRVAPGLVVPR